MSRDRKSNRRGNDGSNSNRLGWLYDLADAAWDAVRWVFDLFKK